MTRFLSALALLPVVVGVIWFLAPVWTLILIELILVLAIGEYANLVTQVGCQVSRVLTGVASMVGCATVALMPAALPLVLMVSLVVFAGYELRRGNRAGMLASVSAAMLALVYLAIPFGAVAALAYLGGSETVLLFVLTLVASDTAQYYGGRTFGRRALAPDVSPGKTVEGALVGVIAATVVMLVAGHWWLAELPPVARGVIGVIMAIAGISGDLFESSLKRSARLKDASSLIPGHGGVLDRLDAFIFAVPVYYAAVLWAP